LCVGKVCNEFKRLVNTIGADSYVRYVGQVSPEMALDYSMNVSSLLVLEADMNISPFLPSKFADYAVARIPILAITPRESAICNYLLAYGGGIAVQHCPLAISQAMQNIFDPNQPGHIVFSPQSALLATAFSENTVGMKYLTMCQELKRSGITYESTNAI
jgi:hypothetical protein